MQNLSKEIEWTAEVQTERGKFRLQWNLEKLTLQTPNQSIINGMTAADANNLADAMKGIVSMADDRFPAGKA